MITNPEQMPEIQRLKNRVLRLYGMQKLSLKQHERALLLIETLTLALADPSFDILVHIGASIRMPKLEGVVLE